MSTKTVKLSVAVLLGILVSSMSAKAQNIINNGSFEAYGGAGYNSNIGAGLENWTIGSEGGVDIVDSLIWQASDGVTSLSLNWGGPDRVYQSVTTVSGTLYNLSFYMAAEIFGGTQFRTMNVLWNGDIVSQPVFEYTGQGPTTMGWTKMTATVLGTGTDVLTFHSTTEANYGPALDNVSLVAVPEPGILIALGIGSLGTLIRRKRQRQDMS